MFRRALWVMFLLCSLIAGPRAVTLAQDPCAGLVASRLSVGGAARVTSPYGLSMKNQPATSAAGASEVSLLPFGATVTLADGPRCNLGYIWWQISLPDGTTGWAAEGSASEYFMEPAVVGLHVFLRSADNTRLMRYFVTPDALARQDRTFTITPVNSTIGQVWQTVEIERLNAALAEVRQSCPDRLAGTIWENAASADDLLALPVPPLTYEFYPAPDGEKLVLVRHFLHDMPRCSTVVPEKIGISQVSVLSADGTETVLFPYPQHGSVPASQDRYAVTQPDRPNVYLDEVVWSPDGSYIAFVAAYLDRCDGAGCYRFHVYVQNLAQNQLYILGEGRHVSWTQGGTRLHLFRLITGAENQQTAHLYSMRPDGTDRQEIWLPGGAVYLSTGQTALGFPWNSSGTRVMVGNAGVAEVMLFNVTDRSFTPPIIVPDKMGELNRLSIDLIRGEKDILWTTIRGDFVVQNVESGDWTPLNSALGSTGVAPVRVRPFATGTKALIEMINGTAYVLDVNADSLAQVMVAP